MTIEQDVLDDLYNLGSNTKVRVVLECDTQMLWDAELFTDDDLRGWHSQANTYGHEAPVSALKELLDRSKGAGHG